MYGSDIPLSNETVFIFLSASTHFKMNCLEELCVDHITQSLSFINACAYMEEAINFKSALLQKKCCERFSESTWRISTENFVTLSQPALSALLDVDEMDEMEASLFLKIKQWMEQQCRNQGLPVNGPNMRHVIGDALYKIHFPTMNVQDFGNYVGTIEGLLTNDELAQVYQKIAIFNNEDFDCPFPTKFRCKSRNVLFETSSLQNFLKKDLCATFGQHYTCNSALKSAKDKPDGKWLGQSLHSLRLVLQCCADLANSSGELCKASPENQETRNEVYDEFLAWQDVIGKTKSVSDIMEKFSELRGKLGKLYKWSR